MISKSSDREIGDRLVAALRDGDVDAHEIGAGPEDRLLAVAAADAGRLRPAERGNNGDYQQTRTSRILASYTDAPMPAPKSWDVLGVGCNSVDHVYRLPASPIADSPTAKLRISSHSTMCGGQMATAMAACAAFGLRAGYLGCGRARPQRPR